MGYKPFGKVKTIVLPVSIDFDEGGFEKYKALYGIDLFKLLNLRFKENIIAFDLPSNSLILFQDIDGQGNLNAGGSKGTLYPLNWLENGTESEGNVHTLKISSYSDNIQVGVKIAYNITNATWDVYPLLLNY